MLGSFILQQPVHWCLINKVCPRGLESPAKSLLCFETEPLIISLGITCHNKAEPKVPSYQFPWQQGTVALAKCRKEQSGQFFRTESVEVGTHLRFRRNKRSICCLHVSFHIAQMYLVGLLACLFTAAQPQYGQQPAVY